MLTGDIRSPRATHLCRNCCRDAYDAAAKLSDAMVVGYLEVMTSKSPSIVKNYTLGEALSSCSGLFMIHDLGAQIIPRAISTPGAEEEDNEGNHDENEDEHNFQKYCHRKQRHAKA